MTSIGSLHRKERIQYVEDSLQSRQLDDEYNETSQTKHNITGKDSQSQILSQIVAIENRIEDGDKVTQVQVKIEPEDYFEDMPEQDNELTNVNFISTYCDVVIKEDSEFNHNLSDGTKEQESNRGHPFKSEGETCKSDESKCDIIKCTIDIVKEETDSKTNKRILTKESKYKYSCNVCSYKTKTYNTLMNHKLIHNNPNDKKLFVCKHCPYATIHRSYIILHERAHSGDKPYSCDVCNIKFSQMRSLSRHKKAHTGDKPYICDICKRRFAQKYNLVKHFRTHTGIKPYSCDMCRLKFSDLSTLTSHRSTHTDDRPYICDICQHKFKRKSVLVEHIKTHSGLKPYQCDKCECKFAKKDNLNNHSRVHTGEKPYTCDICKRKFSQRSNLISHRLTTHPDAKPYTRAEGKMFFQKSQVPQIKEPKIQTDEKPHICNICSRKFKQKCDLTKHTRVHTGDKPYSCDSCECKFSQKGHLITHRRKHTGEKPYACDICYRHFAQHSNLNVHKKTHAQELGDN